MLINFHSKLIKFKSVSYLFYQKMSSAKCKVAVCQFTATNNKENNLNTVKKLISEAKQKDAQIIFLPEGCDYIGSNKDETRALAEPLSGPLMSEYKNLAKTNNVWLSIGGFHELVTGDNLEVTPVNNYSNSNSNESAPKPKFFNSHVLIDESGQIQSVYKKIHLFDVTIPGKNLYLKESDFTQPGFQVVPPIKTPAGLLSLSICYDLRFPELSTLQRKQGANILTYPSAFTHATGLVHWEILLRARAIENQCYVIAAAQYGKHNDKRISYGHALIVNPWGQIVAECPKYSEESATNESIAVAEIDDELVEKVRREMPVFSHRRNDLYQLKLFTNNKPSLTIDNTEIFMFADKIVPGSVVFYKTNYTFAFTNIRCVVPGHVLISSLRPAKRLEDLSEDEVADLFQTAVKVQTVMEKIHGSDSSTVCVQDGNNAGQTVPHVHVHILPRQPNDFKRNDDVYDRLAQHDRDCNPEPVRDIDEMSAEAKMLRGYFIRQ